MQIIQLRNSRENPADPTFSRRQNRAIALSLYGDAGATNAAAAAGLAACIAIGVAVAYLAVHIGG